MRRLLAVACAALALAMPACGGDETAAAPTPTPAPSYRPGEAPAYHKGYPLLGPAGKARDTVDQLDQQQQQQEQNSGGGAYSPTEP